MSDCFDIASYGDCDYCGKDFSIENVGVDLWDQCHEVNFRLCIACCNVLLAEMKQVKAWYKHCKEQRERKL